MTSTVTRDAYRGKEEMRKAELVYLHALFAELRRHFAERDVVPERAADAYADHGVGPNQVHRRKADHEAAIGLLSGELAAALDDPDRADDECDPDPGYHASPSKPTEKEP